MRLAVSKPLSEMPYEILSAYDIPKATIAKLRASANGHGVSLRGKISFRTASAGATDATVSAMKGELRGAKTDPRFLIACDGKEVYGLDRKSDRSLVTTLAEFPDHFDFLLPLAGIELEKEISENVADIRATGKLSKIYDAIIADNPAWGTGMRHDMNTFMTRLLFCFFADDTGIFAQGSFNELLQMHANELKQFLGDAFKVMNAEESKRQGMPELLKRRLPYVNGKLFSEATEIPEITRAVARKLLDASSLDWSQINPDIFGSMVQAIAHTELRAEMGMHYTSVPNILKALKPLFLDELDAELMAIRATPEPGRRLSRIEGLLNRVRTIRVFDPACGSGNFLIVAYKELRRIEMECLKAKAEVDKRAELPFTEVSVSHFYGIEVDDFAVETAKLSLWIAEFQANAQFKEVFKVGPPTLPLSESGRIRRGNATEIEWEAVCPKPPSGELFVVGNPPFRGRRYQTDEQKEDLRGVFYRKDPVTKQEALFKGLDYVACWFLKGARYSARTGAKVALVSTNSICQGEQVAMLWPRVFEEGVEINFAHQSFKWHNNAKDKAAVICVIIGLAPPSKGKKRLYSGEVSHEVSHISPYLVEGDDTIVRRRNKSISGFPRMRFGNMPLDGKNLLLSPAARDELLALPEAEDIAHLIRPVCGSREFINGIERYCLWIKEKDRKTAESVAALKARIDAVHRMRRGSGDAGTQRHTDRPHQFRDTHDAVSHLIVVPKSSSERRQYLPVGILSSDWVVTDLVFAVYDAPMWLLAVLSSTLHRVWAQAIGGKLKTDYRYSNTLVWNTFPLPALSDEQKAVLLHHAHRIIEEREKHADKTLAKLYNPESMPPELLQAHQDLDRDLEGFYIGRAFKSDDERLSKLLKLYVARIEKLAEEEDDEDLEDEDLDGDSEDEEDDE